MTKYRNPVPTVDIIIKCDKNSIILIDRKNIPHGWAIPGGFVDYGESLEHAAMREAKEETSLNVKLKEQFFTYSDPKRDKRQHTITTVFIAEIESGSMLAADDAKDIGCFTINTLPENIAFDHRRIIKDYFNYILQGRRIKLED